MKNKTLLKILALRIREMKEARKETHPDNGKFDEYDISKASHEARCRCIIQALVNRKIDIEAIKDLTKLLDELGVERNLHYDTEHLTLKYDIIPLLDDIKVEEIEQVA